MKNLTRSIEGARDSQYYVCWDCDSAEAGMGGWAVMYRTMGGTRYLLHTHHYIEEARKKKTQLEMGVYIK